MVRKQPENPMDRVHTYVDPATGDPVRVSKREWLANYQSRGYKLADAVPDEDAPSEGPSPAGPDDTAK